MGKRNLWSKLKDSNSYLSLIFNDEVFGLEDTSSACVYERGFFLGLCCTFSLLILIEFMLIVDNGIRLKTYLLLL